MSSGAIESPRLGHAVVFGFEDVDRGADFDVAIVGPAKENEQELRLALAMRGGASMAVWIGGAVAEIDRLREALSGDSPSVERQAAGSQDDQSRTGGSGAGESKPDDSRSVAAQPADAHADEVQTGDSDTDRSRYGEGGREESTRSGESTSDHPWAALATLAGYDSVSVDVLAGASAGGLNATLLTATLVYGMPFESMRRTWVRLADLEAMARPVPKFWQRAPQSLLEGDDYFRAELVRVVRDGVPEDERGRGRGTRADLLLTATLLDPVVEKHFDARSGPLLEERRTAMFRFRHRGRPGQPMSDFGVGKDFDETVLRMAHAARTTSSFPFAFEPANVHSAPGRPPSGEPDMFGLFSEVASSPNPKPYRVIDGGVLDNIPVTAAIRAMAKAPADRPSDRWLLYLNPEPEVAHYERPRGRQFALPVASTAMQARMSQESLLADIEALNAHNRSVERTSLRRKALFAELRSVPAVERQRVLAEQTTAVELDHAVVRAELDAQAVYRLLTEPDGTDDDKLLAPVVGDPLAGWSAQARTQLGQRLSRHLGEQAAEHPARLFDDVRGLLSGVEECLAWARDIERWASADQLAEIGRCKAALYQLLVFAEVLEGHADRYWINGAKLEPIVEVGELDGWVARVARRRARLQHQLPSPVRPLLGAVLADVDGGTRFQRALAEFADELLSIVDSSGADAVPEDVDRVDAVAEARGVLHRLADRLAVAAPERTEFEAEQVGFALLEQAELRSEVLRGLVVLTAPLDVGRVPGSHINFLRVVGDADTPLPFNALRRGDDSTVRIEDKIRGGDLGNFGAFLSAKWRANDWMWGRMDAAASLVGLLVDPARLVRYNQDSGGAGLTEAFGELVARPTTAELGKLDETRSQQWSRFLDALWTEHESEVRTELETLFAHPDDEHPLPRTRALVTERLQWTIAAGEIPFVDDVPIGADPSGGGDPPPVNPTKLARGVKHYSVGRQRLVHLGERRTATMATRLGLIAYRAVRPRGHGLLKLLGRGAMTLIKPLLMAVVLAVAAPRRAAAVAFLAAVVATLVGAGVSGSGMADRVGSFVDPGIGAESPAPPGRSAGAWGCPGSTPGDGIGVSCASNASNTSGVSHDELSFYEFSPHVNAGLFVALPLVVAFAVWFGWALLGRGRGVARWLPAGLIAVVLTAGVVLAIASGFRLGALGVIVAAAVLSWLSTFSYRLPSRALATALTALVFAAVVLTWNGGEWIAVAAALSAYAQMALLGTVDVLRARPRPTT